MKQLVIGFVAYSSLDRGFPGGALPGLYDATGIHTYGGLAPAVHPHRLLPAARQR